MKKLGMALGVAAALALVLFVVVRVVLGTSIPRFQEQSRERIANLSIEYSEPSRCISCHQDYYNDWADSAHKGFDCETCHSPCQAHVDNSALIVAVDKSGALCVLCHSKSESKPSTFPQIVVADHYSDQICTVCHSPYSMAISDLPVIPHSLQGRINVCLSCHKAGLLGAPKVPARDHSAFTSQMCLLCHVGPPQ
jgi:hypothetical protein